MTTPAKSPAEKLNRYLTTESFRLVKAIRASDDGELTWERGAGYWVDNSRVKSRPVNHLLQLCLLRETYNSNETYIIYELSSEVDNVLADEHYEPAILRAQRTGKPQMI